jgi:L-lactate dehydrogenase complex protein LldG
LFRSHDDTAEFAGVPSAVTSVDGSGVELAKMFGEMLEEVLGSYEIVDDSTDLPQRILAQIEHWRKKNDGVTSYGNEVLSWAPSELPIPNIGEQLKKHGVSLFVPGNLHDKEERAHAAVLSVGLTGVDAAFAGTGSMVLIPGPGKSRVASLLPLHHIALVPMAKIHATFESWLASLRREGNLEELFRDHAQPAFVTGPSKSADIELNLTLGVHGPRDVHAIVFEYRR